MSKGLLRWTRAFVTQCLAYVYNAAQDSACRGSEIMRECRRHRAAQSDTARIAWQQAQSGLPAVSQRGRKVGPKTLPVL